LKTEAAAAVMREARSLAMKKGNAQKVEGGRGAEGKASTTQN